jgi:hypothetical protein
MNTQTQQNTATTNIKDTQQLNSQGERITPTSKGGSSFDDVISLSETPLASSTPLTPPTDDSGLVHKVISCGHVLKSTHDMANLSEKRGSHHVNERESLDAVDEIADISRSKPLESNVISLNETPLGSSEPLYPPTDDTGLAHKVISCGHVLKSTHDMANLEEKRGAHPVNEKESLDVVDELADIVPTTATQGNIEPITQQRSAQGERKTSTDKSTQTHTFDDVISLSETPLASATPLTPPTDDSGLVHKVISCGHVLKSTHDMANIEEKRGAHPVNEKESLDVVDELADIELNRDVQGDTSQQTAAKEETKSSPPSRQEIAEAARLPTDPDSSEGVSVRYEELCVESVHVTYIEEP